MYKSVAVFQYDFQIQIHTVNLLLKLADSGVYVEFFIAGNLGHIEFVGLDSLYQHENVQVHYHKRTFIKKVYDKLASKLENYFQFPFLDSNIVKKSENILKDRESLVLIGIEKKGLIWAQKVFDATKDKLIYYSLELYIEDHPSFKNSVIFDNLRKKEKKAHILCDATIIQDADRKNILYKANGIDDKKCEVIYLPVSIKDDKLTKKSNFAYKYFEIEKEKKIILYFGVIGISRFGFDFIKSIEKLHKDYIVVLHGFGNKDYIGKLKELNYENLIISTEILDEDRLLELVNSAYIGLALYSDCCSNDRLTAFSSAKVANYCQCGIPFIGLDIGNYHILQDEFRCCELIKSYKDITLAIDTIDSSYLQYKKSAFDAFDKYYNFNKIFDEIKNKLFAGKYL